MSIKLYTAKGTRGVFAEWYVKELGLDAEIVRLDVREKKEQQSDSYRKINPFQRVPFLTDGDLHLAESGAIYLYLAEKYGGLNKVEDRAVAAQWVFFSQTTLMEVLFQPNMETQLANTMRVLDEALQGKEYLTGNFGPADVSVAAVLGYAQVARGSQANFSEYPAIEKFLQRVRQRPLFRPTMQTQC